MFDETSAKAVALEIVFGALSISCSGARQQPYARNRYFENERRTHPASKRRLRTAHALKPGMPLVPCGPMPTVTPASTRRATALWFVMGRPGLLVRFDET